jgi:hypothetical protein
MLFPLRSWSWDALAAWREHQPPASATTDPAGHRQSPSLSGSDVGRQAVMRLHNNTPQGRHAFVQRLLVYVSG